MLSWNMCIFLSNRTVFVIRIRIC